MGHKRAGKVMLCFGLAWTGLVQLDTLTLVLCDLLASSLLGMAQPAGLNRCWRVLLVVVLCLLFGLTQNESESSRGLPVSSLEHRHATCLLICGSESGVSCRIPSHKDQREATGAQGRPAGGLLI